MNASPLSSALAVVLGGLTLLPIAPSAVAQATAPPAPPTPAPPAPVPSSVLLAYRFPAGRVQRFRANLNSQITLTLNGEPATGSGPRPNSTEMDCVLTCTEKVLGTRDGTGTLLLTHTGTQATLTTSGTKYGVKLVNGKVMTSRNGQPLPTGEVPPGFTLSALQPAPLTLYRAPSGQVRLQEEVAGGGGPKFHFGGMPLVPVTEFPDRALKIGERWQTLRQFVGVGLGPTIPGAASVSNIRLTHTLRTVLRQGRRLIALIETNGENIDTPDDVVENSPVAPGSAPGLVQALVGVSYFDVERGELLASQFAAELTGVITVPAPATGTGSGAGAAGGSMRVDGQIGVRLAEVIEAPSPVVPAPRPTVTKPTAPKQSTPRRTVAPRKR